MLVHCGFEWAGHPGMDNGKLLTLHGRAGNTPAAKVVVVIDDQPPHRIRVRARVDEQTFKFVDYQMWTEISTEPGSAGFRINDTLTNRGDYEREFQIIYHGNFGPPLLQEGSVFEAPVKQVTPFNDYAAKDIATWTTYRGPTRDYDEQVYNVVPFADGNGFTTVLLRDKAGDRGLKLRYNVAELPYFTLWKNTDTEKQGYVTGLEPGTGYAVQPKHRENLRACAQVGGRCIALVHAGLHDPFEKRGCRRGREGNSRHPQRQREPAFWTPFVEAEITEALHWRAAKRRRQLH